ncbi:hypothetical protein IE53DRAFT_311495 [Violaceomyces palustris]|uniref:Uncharacterized protein n=1 Tax=Violaceomyces palustris TaxID=1673888 RepID=A0ACD0P3P9_9BASI|nr:hypothetical protein IE53DRAFT_311495 [Violaceomyces palustris]
MKEDEVKFATDAESQVDVIPKEEPSAVLPPPPVFTPSPSPEPHLKPRQGSGSASSARSTPPPPNDFFKQERDPLELSGPSSTSMMPSLSSASTSSTVNRFKLDVSAGSPSALGSPANLKEEGSASPVAVGRGVGGKRAKKVKIEPQIIDHLAVAEEEAMATFEELEDNEYLVPKIGRSKGNGIDESMVCECNYRHGLDDISQACTDEAGCINRLTQVECSQSDCRCGKFCQNQRFTKREYAPVEIVQTEMKGFGLRAKEDLPSETFIYEYVGEIMNQKLFFQRMQQYKLEGIRHFYFMMLQRDEYIDATKKGGKGRFINHSCNPNCFVAKWHVGKYMRMGIFAKRDIVKGEELTFNYNVDRYGNDAQMCFCGEPNCVGTIGGKTQTDIGTMDDLYIDALGIADEVEKTEARGTRKKKSKELDKDFMPTMRPIEEDEVSRVMSAVRQATSNRRILQKLLTRIRMTEDVGVQKLLVKLHGFTLMSGVIHEWKDDKEILTLAMESLARWPLIARNKVVESGVEDQIKDLALSEDQEIKSLASQLVEAWEKLDMGYRIARREGGEGNSMAVEDGTSSPWVQSRRLNLEDELTLDQAQAPNAVSEELKRVLPSRRPPPALERRPPAPSPLHQRRKMPPSLSGPNGYPKARPGEHFLSSMLKTPPGTAAAVQTPPTQTIEEIIRLANEQEARQRREAEEKAIQGAKEAKEGAQSKKHHRISHHTSSSSSSSSTRPDKRRKPWSDEARKDGGDTSAEEKRLRKMVGELTVKYMSKHKDELERETFKKHAKELTNLITQKEMKNPKSWPPPGGKVEEFSVEKRGKMKAFISEYVSKLLARKGKARTSSGTEVRKHPSLSSVSASNSHGSASASPAIHTPPTTADKTGFVGMTPDTPLEESSSSPHVPDHHHPLSEDRFNDMVTSYPDSTSSAPGGDFYHQPRAKQIPEHQSRTLLAPPGPPPPFPPAIGHPAR